MFFISFFLYHVSENGYINKKQGMDSKSAPLRVITGMIQQTQNIYGGHSRNGSLPDYKQSLLLSFPSKNYKAYL